MDLIYADKDKNDVGVVLHYNLDNELSVDGNNCSFALELPIDEDILNNCKYIYIADTEYGGIVDSQKINTSTKIMNLSGRTWRGILFNKIVVPSTGSSSYSVTGDVNEVLGNLIDKLDLADLFEEETEPLEINVEYDFENYIDAYTGITQMLSSVDCKLMMRWNNGKVKLYAEEIESFDSANAITSDLFNFQIAKTSTAINHVIGIALDDTEETMVVHKYIQADGTIGNVQHYFGDNEYVSLYDKGKAKTLDELEEATIEALEKESVQDQVQIDAYDLNCDLGDKFEAQDIYTGLVVEQYVTNKIVVINDNIAKISYKVGAL